jgi:hypothetical protein
MFLEFVSYLRFTRVLEFAAITVVLMLFSSPTTVFSTLGIGTKLGILSFAFGKKDCGEDKAS